MGKNYSGGGEEITTEQCIELVKEYAEAKVKDLKAQLEKADGEIKPTLEKTIPLFEGVAKAPEKTGEILKVTMDKNKDGKVTKEEFMKKFPKALKNAIEGSSSASGCSV